MAARSQSGVIGYKEGWPRRQERGMTKTIREAEPAQKERTRALVVPREHGAWGLLFVPLFTGVVAGIAPAYRVGPLILFTASALLLFWLRTPVESLLGSGVVSAHTPRERRTALMASCLLATASAACLAALLWGGRNSQLVYIGLIAAFALAVQTALRRLGHAMRMPSQLVGAIALSATAPAAYYLGTGRLETSALILWIANWIFACDQIYFVQLRIHAARAGSFAEKFTKGKYFLVAQTVLFAFLAVAAFARFIPQLLIVAFVPALVRGTLWFFQGARPLNVKQLGWSEMRHGIAFGILLAIAFLVR